jgi:hypothetical protein
LAIGFGFFLKRSAFFLMLANVIFRFRARVTCRARSSTSEVWNIAGRERSIDLDNNVVVVGKADDIMVD